MTPLSHLASVGWATVSTGREHGHFADHEVDNAHRESSDTDRLAAAYKAAAKAQTQMFVASIIVFNTIAATLAFIAGRIA